MSIFRAALIFLALMPSTAWAQGACPAGQVLIAGTSQCGTPPSGFPVATAAGLADFINATQGYVSPSVPGVTRRISPALILGATSLLTAPPTGLLSTDAILGSRTGTPFATTPAGIVAAGASNIPSATITAAMLAAGAVVGNIGAGTVTGSMLASGAAVSNIAAATITGSMLASGASVANGALGQAGGTLTGAILGTSGSSLATDNISNINATDYLFFNAGPGGNPLLILGGTQFAIFPETYVQLSGGTWGSGNLIGGNAPIVENANFAGTTTSGEGAVGMFLQQYDNSSHVNAPFGFRENMILSGSGVVGSATSLQTILTVNAVTGNSTHQDYIGINAQCNFMATDPAGASSSTASACFAANPVAHVGNGITVSQLVGTEIDTWEEAGAVIMDRMNLQMSDVVGATYGTQASRDDVDLVLTNQYSQTSTLGFKVGIEFGRTGGNFPIATGGTIIYAQNSNGTGWTVANGIDWHLGTFSGNSWNDGHVSFSGSGDVLLNSAAALATNATAGFVHLPHTTAAPTGTPANTTPGCEWNTGSHTLNCYDGAAWYHFTGTSGAG